MGKRGRSAEAVSGKRERRERELERENEWLKRQLARAKGRLRKLDLPDEVEESPEPQAVQPVATPASTCPKCKNAATKLALGPREYWTCKPCQWVVPVGK